MPDVTDTSAGTVRGKMAARTAWTLLILLTLYLCYFSHLGALGLVGPDEPRYSWIARDMAETGDWVTPKLYGKPWFEKPVLYYWSAALSFRLFGVSEFSARLPSAVSALLATLSLAWLVLRLYGPAHARWLLLLLPSTAAMIGFSHAASTDMPFSAILTIAMVAAGVSIGLIETVPSQSPPTPSRVADTSWLPLICFGFFLGLAVLAKGPAAIILCGAAIFLWAAVTKHWSHAFRLLHPIAIASFCLTALPWYILCARRNPDFFHVFVIEHNFRRYLTPEFQHIQPFWYYGPILFLGLLPWTGMVGAALFLVFQRKIQMRVNSSILFLLTWGAFPILFFSLSKSKLPGYILFSIPPFIVIAARAIANSLEAERAPLAARLAWFSLTPAVLIAASCFSVFSVSKTKALNSYALASGVLAFLALAVILVFIWRKLYSAAFASGILAWLCFLILTNHLVMPWLDPRISPRTIARTVLAHPDIASEVQTLRLARSWQYGLHFYLHRELPEWSASAPAPRYVLSSLNGIAELKNRGVPFETLDSTSPHAILVKVGYPAKTQR